jgi:hypothetical protein
MIFAFTIVNYTRNEKNLVMLLSKCYIISFANVLI